MDDYSVQEKKMDDSYCWVERHLEVLVDQAADSSSHINKSGKHPSIYRLSDSIAILTKTASLPQVVSFGPYHRDFYKSRPMEDHKIRALSHFLKRSNKPLKFYVDSLAEVEQDLKDAYDDTSVIERTDMFLNRMILDGCFMLEILLIFTRKLASYAPDDPIFSNHGIVYVMPDIKRDMLIISNQLPMLLLRKLLELSEVGNYINEDIDEEFINRMLCDFYGFNHRIPLQQCSHVLEFCQRFLLWDLDVDLQRTRKSWAAVTRGNAIPSATEIRESGIQIVWSKGRSLQDMRFRKDMFRVILSLPPITVGSETETMFLNLLAFERFHVGAGRGVTNYLVFMNNIIRDTKDVSLLRSYGIIENALGRDEVVADLFNSVSKDFTIDPESSVYDVNVEVINYSRRPWVRWRASIMRTYFSSPWASISVIASMFLFAFTFAQTAYAIFAYYQRP